MKKNHKITCTHCVFSKYVKPKMTGLQCKIDTPLSNRKIYFGTIIQTKYFNEILISLL